MVADKLHEVQVQVVMKNGAVSSWIVGDQLSWDTALELPEQFSNEVPVKVLNAYTLDVLRANYPEHAFTPIKKCLKRGVEVVHFYLCNGVYLVFANGSESEPLLNSLSDKVAIFTNNKAYSRRLKKLYPNRNIFII